MNRQWEEVQVVSDADVFMRMVRAGKVEIVLASLNGLGRSVSHLLQVSQAILAAIHPLLGGPARRSLRGPAAQQTTAVKSDEASRRCKLRTGDNWTTYACKNAFLSREMSPR